MEWKLKISRSADKFIEKNQITEKQVIKLTKKAIRAFRGEDTNIDLAKLTGQWKGFYRIKKGGLRIIAEFDFENSVVFIVEIDNRGNIYK